MTLRPLLRVFRILLALLPAVVFAAASEPVDWPTRWWVNGNGASGTLELTLGPSGEVSGMYLEWPVTGFLSGRHLLLRRATGAGTEVWEGWLSTDEGFMAGTITLSERGGASVFPWYGQPHDETGPSGEPAPTSVAARTGHAVPPQTAPEVQGWDLSGFWMTTGGRVEIVQDGRSLAIVLSDGTRSSGRFTALDTVVAGLRKGCCKGQLEGYGVIRWSDGAIWRRID